MRQEKSFGNARPFEHVRIFILIAFLLPMCEQLVTKLKKRDQVSLTS